MGKFFCPKCGLLTYSLQYIFGEKWEKPIDEPQYCKKCKKQFTKKECKAGVNQK